MSCNECRGYGVSYCPICSEEPIKEPCNICNGSGVTEYYNAEGDIITKEVYSTLSTKDRDSEACDTCDGTGEVVNDYEPDYESDRFED